VTLATVLGPPAGTVEARLGGALEDEERRWAEVDPDLAEPFSRLRAFVLGGGKRLRPAFCWWSFVGAGGDAEDPALADAMAALELLHAAALVHDDLIDRSERRHGADTVHVSFASLHRRCGWRGDPDRFGEAAALLVGDLALACAERLMVGAPRAARAVFAEALVEVNAGQYLDTVGSARGLGPGSARRARTICRYKTAGYTVERPMQLGYALADPGGLDSAAEAISAFALPLGEAFQLTDDLLGAFGDPAATGKGLGEDLTEGKPTLLAALAGGRGSPAERLRFKSRFGELDAGAVEAMRAHLEATGARSEVEATVSELIGRAEQARLALPLRPEALAALGEIAAFVAARDR
jgi:geranylgeranyl diphosphate synthase type I